jgi:formate transporter
VGHYILKILYDDLVGVASGATGNPAILVYSTKMAPTERPDIGYAELSFATARVMGGLAFSLGLAIVLVGGAELFTGNNLIVMAWASGDVSTKQILRNWVVVYFGNLMGSVGLAVLVFLSHHLDINGGRVGLSVLSTAAAKIQPDVVTLFFKGVLCNLLVCLAVWLAYAGRSVTDKIVALALPVSAFIAAGFEQYVFPAAGLAADPDGQRSG